MKLYIYFTEIHCTLIILNILQYPTIYITRGARQTKSAKIILEGLKSVAL